MQVQGWVTSLDAPCQVIVSPVVPESQLVGRGQWRSLDAKGEDPLGTGQ